MNEKWQDVESNIEQLIKKTERWLDDMKDAMPFPEENRQAAVESCEELVEMIEMVKATLNFKRTGLFGSLRNKEETASIARQHEMLSDIENKIKTRRAELQSSDTHKIQENTEEDLFFDGIDDIPDIYNIKNMLKDMPLKEKIQIAVDVIPIMMIVVFHQAENAAKTLMAVQHSLGQFLETQDEILSHIPLPQDIIDVVDGFVLLDIVLRSKNGAISFMDEDEASEELEGVSSLRDKRGIPMPSKVMSAIKYLVTNDPLSSIGFSLGGLAQTSKITGESRTIFAQNEELREHIDDVMSSKREKEFNFSSFDPVDMLSERAEELLMMKILELDDRDAEDFNFSSLEKLSPDALAQNFLKTGELCAQAIPTLLNEHGDDLTESDKTRLKELLGIVNLTLTEHSANDDSEIVSYNVDIGPGKNVMHIDVKLPVEVQNIDIKITNNNGIYCVTHNVTEKDDTKEDTQCQ